MLNLNLFSFNLNYIHFKSHFHLAVLSIYYGINYIIKKKNSN